MWIKGEELERLRDCESMKNELEKEVQRLAELISSETKDCKVGPWCDDCKHIRTDRSRIGPYVSFSGMKYFKEVAGVVKYCAKHLHELCPEYEQKSES